MVISLPFLFATVVVCSGLAVLNWTSTAAAFELGWDQDASVLRNQWFSCVWPRLALLALIGLMGGYAVTQRISTPSTEAALEPTTASSHNTSPSVDVRGQYEISELSTSINETIALLDRYITDGDRNVISLPNDNQIRHIQSSLLHAQRLVTLGGFTAEIAHQFRTPLASISTLLQLLSEDMRPGDGRIRYLEAILRSSERLDRLINDLLRIASPGRRVVECCDLKAVVREALALNQARYTDKPLRVTESYSPERIEIQGDRDNLLQAILNIVANAFQAVPNGGDVKIAMKSINGKAKTDRDEHVVLQIHNTGSFIPSHLQQKIFTPFFTTKRGGSGLGLCVANQIIRAHNGRIEIESDAERGTTFNVVLPLLQAT